MYLVRAKRELFLLPSTIVALYFNLRCLAWLKYIHEKHQSYLTYYRELPLECQN